MYVYVCVCVFVGLGTLERVSNARCQCVVCYDGCVSGCVILLVPELDILRSVGSLEPIDSDRSRSLAATDSRPCDPLRGGTSEEFFFRLNQAKKRSCVRA